MGENNLTAAQDKLEDSIDIAVLGVKSALETLRKQEAEIEARVPEKP